MNLIIDIGNTRTKVAFFSKENQMLKLEIVDNKVLDVLQILKTATYKKALISSVKKFNPTYAISEKVLLLNSKTPLPIQNLYKADTLGADRIAAMVAVNEQSPNSNCLVFDLGSAITIDFLDATGAYQGGNISPGLQMRFSALNNFTDNLPLVEACEETFLAAQTTKEAINSGVVKGILFEIESYIDIYEKTYPQIEIFLTGGDAIFFAKQLKKRIFADEKLVLKGLNRILNYNVI
jgi:type III pantothenate kinase